MDPCTVLVEFGDFPGTPEDHGPRMTLEIEDRWARVVATEDRAAVPVNGCAVTD